jgi:hypothetical protein
MKSGKSTAAQKSHWVKISWVKKVTGWNKSEMHRARVEGLISWKHTEEDGFLYDINSIHPLFIKKSSPAETVAA